MICYAVRLLRRDSSVLLRTHFGDSSGEAFGEYFGFYNLFGGDFATFGFKLANALGKNLGLGDIVPCGLAACRFEFDAALMKLIQLALGGGKLVEALRQEFVSTLEPRTDVGRNSAAYRSAGGLR
jgi:hypothetical protein